MFFHRYCLVILYSYGKVPCIPLKLVICNSYVKLMEGSRICLGCLLVRTENPQVCHAMYHLLMLWNISCTLEPKGTSCPSSKFLLGMCWDIHLPNVCWSVSSFLYLKFIGVVCCWPFPNHFNREGEVVNPKKRFVQYRQRHAHFVGPLVSSMLWLREGITGNCVFHQNTKVFCKHPFPYFWPIHP